MRQRSGIALVAMVLVLAALEPQDAASQQLEEVVPIVDYFPFRIAANDSIKRFYITGISFLGGAPLGVLDGNEHTLRFIDLGADFFVPAGLSLNRGTGDVYVVTEHGPVIKKVDALKDEVETIPSLGSPLSAPIGPPFPKLIDLNTATNTLYMLATSIPPKLLAFDLDTQTLSEVGLPEFFALSIAVNSVTNKIFVAASAFDASSGLMAVVDGGDLSVTSVSFGTSFFSQQAIAVNENMNTLYLAGDGVVDGVAARALAIVDGADNTFRILLIDDFEVADLAVNPSTNQVFAVGRESFGEPQLRTIESNDAVRATPLGAFDAHSVAIDRYANRAYVLGTSFQDGPQVLVFAPSGCSVEPRTLQDLTGAVQSLTTSPETIAALVEQLARVQRALDRENPDVARERLARFQVHVVQFSNLSTSDPNAISLADGNRLVCDASNVLGSIELPSN